MSDKTLKLKVDNVDALVKSRAFVSAFRKHLQVNAERLGNRITVLAVENLEHNNTGTLRKSISYNVDDKRNRVELSVGASAVSKHNDTAFDYALAVHEGTKPHWPPVKPMRLWVSQKFPGIRGNQKAINSVAFMVSRKIARVGTEANPFLKEALDEVRPDVEKYIDDAFRKAVQ